MKIFLLLVVGLFFGYNNLENEEGPVIKIQLEGLKDQKGLIGVMIFDQEEGFPTEKEKAIFSKEYPVEGGTPIIRINDLPPGKYAISLIHDVNGNRDLDKNFLGVPVEPFGFSGNKSILFGLPKFEEAAFEVKEGEVESKIELIKLL